MKTLAHSLSRELLTQILTGGDNSQNLIRNSNKLLTLKNSRNFEAEADKGGLQLLIQNHIDINGMSDLFKLMGTISEGKGVPTYLSTHPPIEDRIETIELEIKEEKNDHVYDSKLNNIFEKLINQKEQNETISNEE
jgi:predicted Zn-dependent protease